MSASCKANEYRLIRVYDASVSEVWKAWVELDQVAQWWGPRGFTITTHSKDLQAGGTWKYTMHGPDGTDYPNITLYHEVQFEKRLVYDHGGNEHQPPLFQVTANFSEAAGQTELDMTFAFESAAVAERMKQFIREAGGNTTWDRLAEFLAKKKSNKDIFVINHSFDASPEIVFEMWTSHEHLQRWLPPAGFAMEFLRAKIAEGTSTFYRMYNQNGVEIFARTEYLQIVPNRQIIMRQDFCDQNERLAHHPLAPELPQSILSTVKFTPEEGGGTRVTLTSVSGDSATATEIDRFMRERGGMSIGWDNSFAQLEQQLTKH